ncbi:MAG: hypothetical protein QG656_405, partial [Candidatus Hydrogenedentes bacterium]|nr:hypothetical protein [Candidatus Hydrogenedentota bacterium]
MKDTTKQRWNPLLKTVLFLGIFLAATAGLSTFYRELVLSYTTLYQTDRQFYEQIESVETLCIGDSHAGTSINWTKWPNLFVFWSAGETYAHHYYKLRAILEDPRNRVRRVIASIDPHSLSWRVPAEFREPGYWVKFVDYLELGWRRGETLYFAKEYLRGRFFAYAGDLDMIDEYLQWAIMHGRLGP